MNEKIECSKFKQESLYKNHTIYDSVVEKDTSKADKVGYAYTKSENSIQIVPKDRKKCLFDSSLKFVLA